MTTHVNSIFKFQPRWKELLVVNGFDGEFNLEYSMGIPTIYLPTEVVWLQNAPEWAKNYYTELKTELEIWCEQNDLPLVIEAKAWIEFNKS